MPNNPAKKSKKTFASQKLLGFVLSSKKLLVSVLLLLLVAIAMGQFTPYLTKFIVNSLAAGEQSSAIVFFGIAAGVLLVIEASCIFIQARVLGALGNSIANQIRTEALDNVTKLPLSQFESKPIGSYLIKTTYYANEVGNFFSLHLSSFAINIIRLVAIFAFMVSLNFYLSLLAIAFLLVVFTVMNYLGRVIKNRNVDYKQTDIDKGELLYQNIKGFQAIVLNNRIQKNTERYDELLLASNKAWNKYSRSNELLNPLVEVLWNAGLVAVYLLAFYLVQSGYGVDVGVVVAFLGYMGQATSPISETGIVFRNLAVAYGALDEIYDKQTLSLLSGTVKTKKRSAEVSSTPHLVLQGVCSTHTFKVDILKNICFEIPFGQKVYISGQSGSGKTTLAKLISGLYTCESGSVLVDNVPIEELTPKSLMQTVGLLTSENFVLNGTIKQNILLGIALATEEELNKVAKQTGVWQFASKLPNGLDTIVGAGSDIMLSEAEKLCIGLARLVLQNPNIIILDEAIGHLDSKQEAKFMKAFNKLFEGKTIVYIDVAFKDGYLYNKHIRMENGEVQSITTNP